LKTFRDESKTAAASMSASIDPKSRLAQNSWQRRTISTFSCDIARPVSRPGLGSANGQRGAEPPRREVVGYRLLSEMLRVAVRSGTPAIAAGG